MVGVAVSGIGRTPIKFAVPSEAVREMLAGRVHEFTIGHPYKAGPDVIADPAP